MYGFVDFRSTDAPIDVVNVEINTINDHEQTAVGDEYDPSATARKANQAARFD